MRKPEGRGLITYAMTVAQNSFELRDVEISEHQINMAYLKMLHAPQEWWDQFEDYIPLSRIAKDLLLEAKEYDEGDAVPV